MTEPPTKRAKRTDSAAMWESNASRRSDSPHHNRPINGTNDVREDRDRHYGRGDARHRSRSRDKRRDRSRSRERVDKRRQRSYSRERDSRRHRDGERNGVRDRRDRDRSRSRHRHRPRRDEPPSKRTRSRSASPRKDSTSTRTRTRTPPHSSRTLKSTSPPPKHPARPTAPPSGPRSSTKAPPTHPASPPHTAAPSTNGNTASKPSKTTTNPEDMDLDDNSDPNIAEMRRAMGFTGFKSTKNTKVKGNNVYGVRKEKKTEYRQYMNRVGGFNRPLSPSR